MKTFVEPQREVMRRVSMCFGVSLAAYEERLLVAAKELVVEGYLKSDGSYPCYGTTYTRFVPTERVDMEALKHI